MERKTIIIDGGQFSDLEGFYDEVEKKLVQNRWGRNLNALDDILYGGFGGREYNEVFVLIWKNAEKSRTDLGYPETVKLLEKTFYYLQPGNRKETLSQLLKAKEGTGETLFDTLADLIRAHSHIEFRLE